MSYTIACASFPGLKELIMRAVICLPTVFYMTPALWGENVPEAQDTLRHAVSLHVKAVYATSDHLLNTYVIGTDNSIVKFDSTGVKTGTYSNNRLGRAVHVDASNPLKILVWYPDFQTVVFLDRTLTEMGRIDLARLGLGIVRAVAVAFDGNLWVFDDAGSKAQKRTLEGELLFESQPLNLAFPRGFSALCIRDNGREVYLSDPLNGLCVLDPFANLTLAHPFLLTGYFDVAGEWLVYTDQNNLNLQRLQAHQQLLFPLPIPGARCWPSSNGLYVSNGSKLEVYRWQ